MMDVPKEIESGIEKYIADKPNCGMFHPATLLRAGYTLAQKELEEKDKEIERLKGLIEDAFHYTPRLNTHWEQFKTENNL